jgi:phosphate-selective porin
MTPAGVPAAPAGHALGPIDVSAYTQESWVNSGWGSDALAVRRAKLTLSWQPTPNWASAVQLFYAYNNGAVTDNRLWIKDAFLQRRVGAGWLTLGQFKPTFGMEQLTSDYVLPTIERSQVSDRLAPNGGLQESFRRDLGAQWQGQLSRNAWMLTLGMFAGNGALAEHNGGNGPLFTARLVRHWHPGPKSHLQLGLSASTRHDHDINFSSALPGTSALGTRDFRGQDTRWNLQAAADMGHYQARAEFTQAFFDGDGVRFIQARGWYIEGVDRFSRRWEGVVRQEGMTPDVGVTNLHEVAATTVGVNWLINDHSDEVRVDYTANRETADTSSPNLLAVEIQHFW